MELIKKIPQYSVGHHPLLHLGLRMLCHCRSVVFCLHCLTCTFKLIDLLLCPRTPTSSPPPPPRLFIKMRGSPFDELKLERVAEETMSRSFLYTTPRTPLVVGSIKCARQSPPTHREENQWDIFEGNCVRMTLQIFNRRGMQINKSL